MIDQLGGIFFGITGIFLSSLLAYAIYESYALLTGHTPITVHVRNGIQTFPKIAFAAAIVIGLLAGHFFWGQ